MRRWEILTFILGLLIILIFLCPPATPEGRKCWEVDLLISDVIAGRGDYAPGIRFNPRINGVICEK